MFLNEDRREDIKAEQPLRDRLLERKALARKEML